MRFLVGEKNMLVSSNGIVNVDGNESELDGVCSTPSSFLSFILY